MTRAALVALAVLALLSIAAAHVDAPGTCSAVRCHGGDYDYNDASPHGPAQWGNLHANYAGCRHGRRQSPFNVLVDYARPRGNVTKPTVTARRAVLQFKATSNNFKFDCAHEFGPCSHIQIGETEYELVQVHLHSPSEYHIGGVQYPLELHFVHRMASSEQVPAHAHRGGAKLAVVAVMFEVGQFNRQLQKLLDAARNRDYAVVDLSSLVSAAYSDTCAFEGSLTTPPCSEGVQWILSLGRLTASLQQIGEYRAMVGEKSTNRPLQKANGRLVVCYPRSKDNAVIPGII